MNGLDRRDFLKKFGAGVALVALSGCSNSDGGRTSTITGSGGNSGSNNGSGSGSSGGSSSGYVPQITKPYSEAAYSLMGDAARSNENMIQFFHSGESPIFLRDWTQEKGVNGARGTAFSEFIRDTKAISVSDPAKQNAPLFSVPDSGQGELKNYYQMARGNPLTGNVHTERYGRNLPDWRSSYMSQVPGMVYLGRDSLAGLSQKNSPLQDNSVILNFVSQYPPNSAFGIVSGNANVADRIDDVINAMKVEGIFMSPFNGSKNQVFDVFEYAPSSGQSHSPVLVLADQINSPSSDNIKDLFPTEIGSSWTYNVNGQNVSSKITGTTKINGVEVLVWEDISLGGKSYGGFYGNEFRLVGAYDPQIGNMFFKPALTIGDAEIRPGKKYNFSNSEVIYEGYPELRGVRITGEFSVEGREDVTVNGRTYGECYRIRQTMSAGNSDKSVTISSIQYSARNLGNVKVSYPDLGVHAELVEAEIMNKANDYPGGRKTARDSIESEIVAKPGTLAWILASFAKPV